MTEARGQVSGKHNTHHVTFFGLSTCIWCKKTRRFLEELDVTFDYTYVDLLHGQERQAAKEQVKTWNPSVSFPTIVVDDDECLVGYKPEELKEVLGL